MSDFKPFKIGKYLLLERLATGGMAEVYRARASGAGGFEKQLAIKRILPNYSSNEEFRRMFEYEARLSSMLTHANIVQIYDFVKSNETYLLAMEYVDGKNLRQFVNKVKKMGYTIPIEFSVYVVNEVCKGLEYAHNKKDDLTGKPLNIIHRDMSPQNIMISYEGAVKIVDFGIAKAKDRVDETRSGVIKGKFGYMSPEQANGLQVDHRTDIFSTAIILYELLTNRRLFAADNDLATLKLIQECVIPKPAIINPKISFELEKILMKGLTKDGGTRYQHAGHFHRQLQEYLNKEFPSFTLREASDILHRVFASEIDNEKKRFEQLHRQPIPFTQGAPTEDSDDELVEVKNVLEGDTTRSQHSSNTAVTSVDEDLSSKEDSKKRAKPFVLSDVTNASGTALSHSETLAQERTQVESVVSEEDSQTSFATEIKTRDSVEIKTQDSVSTQMKEPSIKEVTQEGMPLVPEKPKKAESSFKAESGSFSESTDSKSTEKMNKVGSDTQKGTDTLSVDENTQSGLQQITGNTVSQYNKGPMGQPLQNRSSISLIQPLAAADEEGVVVISNESSIIAVERPQEDPAYHSPSEDRSQEEPVAPPRKSTISFLLVFGLLGTTVLMYRFLFTGRLIAHLPRPPAAEEESIKNVVSSPAAAPYKTHEDKCGITIASDPPGATIFINKTQYGVSPTVVAVKCKESINVTMKREGYESLSANIFVDKKDQNFMKSLHPIPMGELEFILDVNARVIVDGSEVGMATANTAFNLRTRTDVKHKITFSNEVLGLENSQIYTAQEGLKRTFKIKMTDPSTRPRR
jgi:serine/threonine protein kinase